MNKFFKPFDNMMLFVRGDMNYTPYDKFSVNRTKDRFGKAWRLFCVWRLKQRRR